MTTETSTIIWTVIDEAPALATLSLLPIVQAFTQGTGVSVETRDISLAGRIIAVFPECLTEAQRIPDYLAQLGELTQHPEANIIKLPNVSASVPQLKEAIKELQAHGYAIPDYPEAPKDDAEKALQARFAKALGSAVNPVLREGNSDRRSPLSVKAFSEKHPHKLSAWAPDSQAHVAHMTDGDFYGSESSVTIAKATTVRYEFVTADGPVIALKSKLALKEGEILDTSVMRVKALRRFFEEQIEDAKTRGLLLSLHLKATMMKVSDPVIFAQAVTVFYKAVFDKHAATFAQLGVNPSYGLGDIYAKIQGLSAGQRAEIEADIAAVYATRPALAMVDSDKGITNLHVPSDIIVDASMPVVVRDAGKMWGADGKPKDTKAINPESTFARIYQEVINFCKTNGNFDPVTMGTVPNVGLMAQQAEEYGSHDKTFEVVEAGEARIVDIASGQVLLTQNVEEGDIWRMCQVKDAPIRDWVKLAVTRARNSGMPAVFWLDTYRPHENEIIKKVELYLKDHDTSGLDIQIMSQVRAMRYTLERVVRGQDTISVTGNILRDYLTDLFPIMELGTSSKMLSVVPLMAGGGLYETGAGGSAPKHVQQLTEENHLRWDSLGEFLAIAASLEDLGIKTANDQAKLLAKTLDAATGKLLDNSKNPSPKTGQLDNRGSQFYLTLYWAQALAAQTQDKALQALFAPLAKSLTDNEQKIVGELNAVQGKPVDIGGYFKPDTAKMTAVMRPSATFNTALETVKA